MTEAKKYRRRVTDERVDRIAYITEEHPATVRAVLEADSDKVGHSVRFVPAQVLPADRARLLIA